MLCSKCQHFLYIFARSTASIWANQSVTQNKSHVVTCDRRRSLLKPHFAFKSYGCTKVLYCHSYVTRIVCSLQLCIVNRPIPYSEQPPITPPLLQKIHRICTNLARDTSRSSRGWEVSTPGPPGQRCPWEQWTSSEATFTMRLIRYSPANDNKQIIIEDGILAIGWLLTVPKD